MDFDTGHEVDVLRKTVEKQKETIEDLCSELEEERNASSSAANEYFTKMGEIQREARQFKRSSDRKMANHQKEILELKDELNKREEAIQSLTTEVQSYKDMVMENEQENLALKDELNKREHAIQSLTTQVQSSTENQQEILALKDELNEREQAIQSLTAEVQSYNDIVMQNQQEILELKDELNKREKAIQSLTTEIRLKKQQEERENKRRYEAEPHLYTIIKVARDEDLREQVGKDIYFDLVDLDKVHSFWIQKKITFNLFKEEVAKEFGIPVEFQRFWIWAKRVNHTFRPYRPLTPPEETQKVEQLRDAFTKTPNAELKLFLEVELGQIEDGDIICFQKRPKPETVQRL